MYPRFSETFVVNEMRQLEQHGLDVHILALRKPSEGIFHESVCRVKARASYAPSSHHGRLVRIARDLGKHLRRDPRRFARAMAIVRADDQATWFELARAAYVLRWARKQAIRHVHVHFGTGAATVALLAHVLGDLPFSLTLHAYDIFRDDVNPSLLAQKINASRFAVTVSEYNRGFLVEQVPGVDPSKIRVNYNGVDLDRFHPNGGPRDPFFIFGLGRLKEKKGFIHLIRAVRRLRKDGFPVHCRIAGEGEEESNLRKAIARWDLERAVDLCGPVNEDQVRDHLNRCGCFVLPCVAAADGNVDALPTVLLESLACGCPSVSTRLSGVPEIIEDGVSGLLVEPGDHKALARAIRKTIEDPGLTATLAQGGRSRAEERFDIRRNVTVMGNWFRTESHGASPWSEMLDAEPAASETQLPNRMAVPEGLAEKSTTQEVG
jgi:glycosyltransferase involved in cell wall biosynthesis